MKLRKDLGLIDIFCLASGAMISSGLFILPGLAHAKAGPAVVASYFLAGLLALTGMLSQAELVSAMPKSGGTYFYVRRTMGPAMGAVNGLITWFSLTLKSAFALVGMAAFTGYIINLDVRIIALGLCAVFVLLNILGVKEASKVQVGLVIALFAALIVYVVRGTPAVKIDNLTPFTPYGTAAVFSTAGFVFISFGGLLKVASVAEEVKNPGKTIPLGMILALLIVTLLYVAVVYVTTGVLGGGALDTSLTPISDGAAVFLGRPGRIFLGVAAIFAFISTANAGIMAASRYSLALSRDGLLPGHLSAINGRFKTPHASIFLTGIVMAVFLFLKLDTLVESASAVMILTYMFSCLSMIILRESRLQNYQPLFRTPLYPWLQFIGIAGSGFLLVEMGRAALTAGGLSLVIGFLVYWVYGRIKAGREFALLHIIERITSKELTTGSLESELKEIIRERDDIVKDRFDHLVEKAIILDLPGRMRTAEMFAIVADEMASRLGIERAIMMKLLHEREMDSSTVLTPHLAIPHIVIHGEGRFEILLARCQGGVEFSDIAPDVKAVFVLAGTRDERNFHLRALAGLAQIVQDPQFDEKWIKAKDSEALRDLILLGKRRRQD
jgi:amino acid transporter/mannitol/fructose-specific phosphotransferase system IIA component (Ntr-type)